MSLAAAAVVVASLAAGVGARSQPVHAASPASRYHPLSTPQRLVDTRLGLLGIGRRPAGSIVPVVVSGQFGIPTVAQGLTAVVASVTVTDTVDIGYVTVWPADQPLPNASNLNWGPGETAANLVQVAVAQTGAYQGGVDVYVNFSPVSLIIDVEGYYQSDAGPSGLYRPIFPDRFLDTRTGLGGTIGPVGPRQTVRLAIAGHGNVPANASAVAINLTETDAAAPSYLAVFPYADGNAGVSNLNFVAGQTRAARAIVRLDSSGSIGIYNSEGTVQVIVDISGWFTDASDPTVVGGHFVPLTPVRILDTRVPGLGHYGALGPAYRFDLQVGGAAGVPVGAAAVVMNLTLTDSSAPTFVVGYPAGSPRTPTSDVNFSGGGPVPNLDFGSLPASGALTLYNSEGTTQLIGDVTGYYEAVPAAGTPPSTPISFTASAGDRTVHLAWAPPASSGGSLLQDYAITASGAGDVTVPATQTSYDWSGLTNTVSYTFTVQAVNATGASAPVSAAATPLGTPDAVTGITITRTAGTLTLAWSSPANNGGATVTGYYVWVSPSSPIPNPVGTVYNGVALNHLDPGTAYSFTIRALNSYGAGLPAYAGPVQPGPVTGTPQRLRIPFLGVYAAVEAVPLDASGDLGSPASTADVAWSSTYVSPGEFGDAIMTGHKDWYTTSCAVFCLLDQSYVGMDIYVDSADGHTYHFVVDSMNYYAASSPPSWLFDEVGNGVAMLSLVTCAGDFINGGYDQRLIVHSHQA